MEFDVFLQNFAAAEQHSASCNIILVSLANITAHYETSGFRHDPHSSSITSQFLKRKFAVSGARLPDRTERGDMLLLDPAIAAADLDQGDRKSVGGLSEAHEHRSGERLA